MLLFKWLTSKRFMLFVVLVALAVFGAAWAQAQGDGSGPRPLWEIALDYIRPRSCRSGLECSPLWDIVFIYPIIIGYFVCMGLQSDKEVAPTLILAGSLLFAVLSKLGPYDVLDRLMPTDALNCEVRYPSGLLWLVMHVGMFIFPALVAGMARGKAQKSMGVAIGVGVWAAIHMFAFWFLVQRTSGATC
jgi:hypothetical protein